MVACNFKEVLLMGKVTTVTLIAALCMMSVEAGCDCNSCNCTAPYARLHTITAGQNVTFSYNYSQENSFYPRWCIKGVHVESESLKSNTTFTTTNKQNLATFTYHNLSPTDSINGQTFYLVNQLSVGLCDPFQALPVYSEAGNFTAQWILLNIIEKESECSIPTKTSIVPTPVSTTPSQTNLSPIPTMTSKIDETVISFTSGVPSITITTSTTTSQLAHLSTYTTCSSIPTTSAPSITDTVKQQYATSLGVVIPILILLLAVTNIVWVIAILTYKLRRTPPTIDAHDASTLEANESAEDKT